MKIDWKKVAEKHGTDKASHGYMQYYQKYMPVDNEWMLEIGCMHGNSLRMWRELFPQCYINCLDLFENTDFASQEKIVEQGFITYKGDQSSLEVLKSITPLYDVIIDDGSHAANHMIISLLHLFEHNLMNGGLYVVEDLHCNADPFFWNGVTCKEDTLLESVKRPNSWFWLFFKDKISKYELHDDKILFLWKK